MTTSYLRRAGLTLAALAIAIAGLTGCMGSARQLADPSSTAVAPVPAGGEDAIHAQLGALHVETPHPAGKYERAKFGRGWASQGHGCDTRETVLRDQGLGVRTDAQCRPVAGSWRSPYDDKLWTRASEVDIDHVVPLGEAWASGAWAWTPDRRIAFANDLTDPQLIAVTDTLNQEKGDKTPDRWKPPLVSYWHTYASNWITVKAKFGLTITAPEKKALELMLR
jgi:hypothetical protein